MAKYSKLWLELFEEEYFLGAAATSLDYLRNHRRVKLSHIDINKRKFNYWKSEGLFEQLEMNPQQGGWLEFNSIDEIALLIVGRLWDFGFSVDTIKKILHFFYDDSIIEHDIKLFINSKDEFTLKNQFESERPNLQSFLFKEKNNRKKLLNNLEIILIYISQKPDRVSVVYDSECNLVISINNYYFNTDGKPLYELNLEGTYLSVSISEIVSSVLLKTKESGHKQFVEMFQSAIMKPDKEYKYEELPIDININSAIKEYQNQDILIEIRNKKKHNIKRTIISPKKK